MTDENTPRRGFVVLLRGINVGSHRPLPMADLREVCRSIGLEDVATHIQTGNVVCNADEAASAVAESLRAAIDTEFGYDVPVVVREREEYLALLEDAPFEDLPGTDEAKLYVTFLHAMPEAEAVDELEAESDDVETYVVGDRAVYSVVRREKYEPKRFSNEFVESTLGVPATTRNWAVTQRLGELLG